jgi:hypothetical protein
MNGRCAYFPLLLLVALLLLSPSLPLHAEEGVQDHASTEAMMAGLSDAQVRQLLLAELQKDLEAAAGSDAESSIGGISGPISDLLQTLEDESDASEDRVQGLWAGIPGLPADLHRVFVTL